jgi:hypothetical protein
VPIIIKSDGNHQFNPSKTPSKSRQITNAILSNRFLCFSESAVKSAKHERRVGRLEPQIPQIFPFWHQVEELEATKICCNDFE